MQEEVSERHRYRRRRSSIPVNLELEPAEGVGRPIFDRHPHTIDRAGSTDIGEDEAGTHWEGFKGMALGAAILDSAGGLRPCRVFRAGPPAMLAGPVAEEIVC